MTHVSALSLHKPRFYGVLDSVQHKAGDNPLCGIRRVLFTRKSVYTAEYKRVSSARNGESDVLQCLELQGLE